MELKEFIEGTEQYIEDPAIGLPEEVFLFATEITPMVNVDLIVRDERGRILLSWRDDEYCGTGWHVPGGVVRLKETLEERVQKTAWKEIGSKVEIITKEPKIKQLIHKNQKIRGHFITLIYECRLPKGIEIDNKGKKPMEPGYLAWHDKYPDDMIEVHTFYRKYFG